jgi:hypothetical protein
MRLPASRVPHTDIFLPVEQSMGPWNRALFLAIERQDLEAVQLALARGAQVNSHRHFEEISTDGNDRYVMVLGGMTPLHHACLLTPQPKTGTHHVLALVACLLEAGADPNKVMRELKGSDSPPLSVLDAASMSEEAFAPAMCAMLCRHGARPTGLTVSLAAVQNPHFETLVPLYFGAVPPDQRTALFDHQPLDDLAAMPIGNEIQIQRMACLVKLGADMDNRGKGRKLTPAQAIVVANPGRGEAVVQHLRKITATAMPWTSEHEISVKNKEPALFFLNASPL